jgi:REP-associated tyrosine transposase
MLLTPFTSLSWAYQLHYYLCFRTHRRHPLSSSSIGKLPAVLGDICAQYHYKLLECRLQSDHVNSVISLQPAQSIAKVMQTIKANTAREIAETKPVWARGYLARSVGRMRIDAVRLYLEQQAKHHGYDSRVLPPVYRFRAAHSTQLEAAHTAFELNHHLVFATQQRKGFFTRDLAHALSDYWLRVAAVRGFAVDQLSFVPDHVHLLVRIVPKMSIEECALSLLNNGQHFIEMNYPQVLVQTGMEQLWEPSAYAGTCGEVTTTLLKS